MQRLSYMRGGFLSIWAALPREYRNRILHKISMRSAGAVCFRLKRKHHFNRFGRILMIWFYGHMRSKATLEIYKRVHEYCALGFSWSWLPRFDYVDILFWINLELICLYSCKIDYGGHLTTIYIFDFEAILITKFFLWMLRVVV